MAVVSAGILLYRAARDGSGTEIFIAHMGGPFWAKKDGRAWSVPKGLLEVDEESLAAAKREFAEEIGVPAPDLHYVLLGDFRQKSGKIVRIFTAAHEAELAFAGSNTFEVEWPPRSGQRQEFAEIDEARWVSLRDAAAKLVAGQVPAIDALSALLSAGPPDPPGPPGP